MTEELLELYKQVYETGVFFYQLSEKSPLNITATPMPKVYSQHQFPEYEYSRKYPNELLQKVRK
jgi:hypothetical protein